MHGSGRPQATRPDIIDAAHNIVVLERGHIVEQGNHLQLLERHGVYAALWRLPFECSGLQE